MTSLLYRGLPRWREAKMNSPKLKDKFFMYTISTYESMRKNPIYQLITLSIHVIYTCLLLLSYNYMLSI
jgi:hypothetical protein